MKQQRKAFTALTINKSYAKVKQQMNQLATAFETRKWFDQWKSIYTNKTQNNYLKDISNVSFN